MKIALAQINTTVGDVFGNLQKIKSFYEMAVSQNADLVVYPEHALCGYPLRDLIEGQELHENLKKAQNELLSFVKDTAMLVGTVIKNESETGKPYYNSVLFIANGKIISTHSKTLLPTYDVFDEGRHFESSNEHKLITWKNKKIGVTICEDIWGPYRFAGRRLYGVDPIPLIAKQNPDLLINLSASPYSLRKHNLRETLLKDAVKLCKCPALMCNQVGGNDELIFDGHSIVANVKGEIVARGKMFEEDLVILDTDNLQSKTFDEPSKEYEMYNALVLGLKDYVRKCGFKKVAIGISGGIDSAVVAEIAVKAVGNKNVIGVMMPSRYTTIESVNLAKELCDNLDIKLRTLSIEKIYQDCLNELSVKDKITVAEENIQARIRGNMLMHISNSEGALVLSTGNKSEIAMGYCTLYGDMAGGLAVISDLFKTSVYKIANYINESKEIIPSGIINRPPSAELRPNQKDSDSLPSYEILDAILYEFLERRLDENEIVKKGFDRNIVKNVIKTIEANEYKRRQSPIGLKLSQKAFGTGRRLPIAMKR